MSFFALGRLKNDKVPHLHPNSPMFMPLDTGVNKKPQKFIFEYWVF